MPEYYWTLIIETGWVQAALWTIGEDKKAQILSTSSPAAWEAEEDLVGAIDASLSSAIQGFPDESIEPSKTVFGVPPSWVSEGQISSEHLDKIRVVCSKLSLEPTGFVVLSEAIAYYVKSEEGSPLTGVVVGLGKDNLDIGLFKMGNLVGNVAVARSVSLFDDVIEGLSRFPKEDHLPSRFLLYDGKSGELEQAKDTLSQSDWPKSTDKVKFLHTPKVEIVDPDKKVVAVSLSGASEIAGAVGVEIKKEEKADEDTIGDLEVHANVDSQTVDPSQIGFAVGHDIADTFETHGGEDEAVGTHPGKPLLKGFALPAIFGKLFRMLPKFSIGRTPKLGRVFQQVDYLKYAAIALAVAIVGIFLAWWFLPKAEVTIYVSPKKLSKTEVITVDTKEDSLNIPEKILPGKVIKKEFSSERTAPTTGTRTVGEKAHGRVQIRNGTGSGVRLSAGTALLSSSNLKFTLDNSASVSAATSPTSPGTITVDVSAGDIGSEYNLATGESFKIANYPKSEVDGIADGNFSGGSSREVQAVSEEDRKKLETDLTNELVEKGKSEIGGEVTDDEYLIEDAVVTEAVEKSFNHKAGDEASSLKLTMTVEVSVISVKREDLTKVARSLLESDVSGGYVLRDDQIEFDFELQDEDGGVWELETTSTANLLPEVKPEEIAEKIKGKYPKLAESYLMSIPGFSRAEIKLIPPLPGRLGLIPRVVKNISIEIASDR